ncbi:unnamed protein product [Mycena citricolor]|uniref:Uncharacterized protein n=1 Tax=Mycena citricolor TaxID=2018698 RepID=A0AAD2H3U4_9AGAR|nr:unnamed protein product [Mycena citricolor]CAK5269252.1 unnamed protein product [Mycena citricolor]
MSSSQPTDVPPFFGAVETTMNALRLIHAARQGVIPRITRRLNDAERRTMIKSGAVFVFSVEESGIKRWTDGLLWSPSRIVGNFLVYREINERSNSRGSHKKLYPSDEQSRALAVGRSPLSYRSALTDLTAQSNEHGTFKHNGLIKKTITVTIEGSDLHLISYYTSVDQHSGKLKRPSSRPDIMGLPMDPRLFRATNFRVPPKVEKGPDGISRLVETEDPDVVECKVEDESYSLSVSPSSWGSDGSSPGSPVENSFGSATALYPSVSAASYPRVGSTDRWAVSTVPTLRPDTWSHHYSSASRREMGGGGHSDSSWSLSSARWHGDAYQSPPSPTSNVYVDRSRTRSTNPYPTPLQIPSRRDADAAVSRYGGGAESRSRLPWLLSGESTEGGKDVSRGYSVPSVAQGSIYSPATYVRPMSSHGYGSSWSTASSSSLSISTSPQATFSSPSSLGSFGSAYTSSSGSPEDYSNTDDYGES